MFNPNEGTESSGVEIVDKAEPYVQAEVEKMNGWYKWKLKARVRGDNVEELVRIIMQAEKRLREELGTQVKEIDGKL
jgi:hypothetical protein